MQARSRGISVLAILFWLAGAVNVLGALQEFGHSPSLAADGGAWLFENQLDGWILAAAAIISLFLAGGLWAGHGWATRAVLAVAVFNILAVIFTRFEGGDSWLNAAPGIAINVAILLYARTAGAQAMLRG